MQATSAARRKRQAERRQPTVQTPTQASAQSLLAGQVAAGMSFGHLGNLTVQPQAAIPQGGQATSVPPERSTELLMQHLGADFFTQLGNSPFSGRAQPAVSLSELSLPLPESSTSSGMTAEELREMELDPDADSLEFECDNLGADMTLSQATLPPLSQFISLTPMPMRTRNLINQGRAGRPASPLTSSHHVNRRTLPPIRAHAIVPTQPLVRGNSENAWVHTPATPHRSAGTKRTHDEQEGSKTDEDVVAASIQDDEEIRPAKKKGYRASDLTLSRKRILERALPRFRLQLSASHPYPMDAEGHLWSAKAWYAALGQLVESHGYAGTTAPVDDEIALIKMHVNQLRGQVKVAARQAVPENFGFKNSKDIANINEIRQQIEKLKECNAYIYKDPTNTKAPNTMFRAKIIEDVIYDVWFGKQAQSEAILHPEYFGDKVPLPVIALVVTAIHGALDEWQTGIFKKIPFSAKAYEPVYDTHLKNLVSWEVYSSTRAKGAEKLQEDLLEGGRTHAGVGASAHVEGVEVFSFSDAQFSLNA